VAVDPPPPGEGEEAAPPRFFIADAGRFAASPYFFVPA
jgi:hypothetical protein